MQNLPVPYLSQYDFSLPEIWRPRACTIVNLFMALSYYGKLEGRTINELLDEASAVGGFCERGWKHDVIIELAKKYGVPAHREEFRNKDPEEETRLRNEGYEKIRKSHERNGLPIVSLKKNNGSYHTVLVVGSDERGFLYHDPEVGPNLCMPKEDFMSSWRGLAMFIGL